MLLGIRKFRNVVQPSMLASLKKVAVQAQVMKIKLEIIN